MYDDSNFKTKKTYIKYVKIVCKPEEETNIINLLT